MAPVLKPDGSPAFYRLAASNSEDDFCDVQNLQLALLRRFAHVVVQPGTEEVVDFLFKQKLDSRVISFLQSSPMDLFPQKWEDNLRFRKANPFPSTWEAAARLINNINDKKVILSLVSACVGSDLAAKFTTHCEMVNKVDMDKILHFPAQEIGKLKADTHRAPILYSIIVNLAGMLMDPPKKLKDAEAKILTVVDCVDAEYQATFLRMYSQAAGNQWARKFSNPTLRPLFESIAHKCKGTLDEFTGMK